MIRYVEALFLIYHSKLIFVAKSCDRLFSICKYSLFDHQKMINYHWFSCNFNHSLLLFDVNSRFSFSNFNIVLNCRDSSIHDVSKIESSSKQHHHHHSSSHSHIHHSIVASIERRMSFESQFESKLIALLSTRRHERSRNEIEKWESWYHFDMTLASRT